MASDYDSPKNEDTKQTPHKLSSKVKSAREARLAENLRANLRRRKIATRKIKSNKNEAGA